VLKGRTVIPGGPSPQFAQRIASEFGRGSGTYRARVEGEFPDQGEDALFRRSSIERAVELFETGAFAEEARRAERVISIDVARMGADQTVLAVRKGPVLSEFVAWSKADTMESVERIRTHLARLEVRPFLEVPVHFGERGWSGLRTRKAGGRGTVVVDEVGIGSGVLDRLKELGYDAKGYNGGRRPSGSRRQAERFANARAQDFWNLRELLEAEAIALPPDEELADELLATTWRPTPEGKIALPRKEEIKSLIGRSPDRADALAMAFAGSIRHAPRLDPVYW